MIFRLFLYTVMSLVAVYCNAGTIDPKRNDNEYINYATKYPFVLPIVVEKQQKISQGTCVALGDDYFLTAAHVVANSRKQHVVFSNSKHNVLHIVIPSEFNETNILQYDIAVGRLEKPIKCNVYPKIYYGQIIPKERVYIVGYGKYGNFDIGSVATDGQKRAGTNTIDKITSHTMWCNSDLRSMTPLEIMISEGDSGGGIFLDNFMLIGINSGVYAVDGIPDSSYNDYSIHTRLSVYKQWIVDAVKYLETK